MGNTYRDAGVNIEAGYEAVERIKKHAVRTNRLGVFGQLGSFGGVFDLSALNLNEPVLVSGTDGVGTKLKLAFQMDKHDTIGIDCVAMCVNDIVVQGAEPLYFLDYIACGKAIPEKIEAVVKGIADGCEQAGCALIGGETAEMPGLYDVNEYDLAGFSVGACEKSELITGEFIQENDVLIGLSSSGIHSNGYSLVRKIFFEDHQLSIDEKLPELEEALGTELITPTKIYVKPILEAMAKFKIKGMAHITGGGFIENIPRMLPSGLGAEIQLGTWPILPIFKTLKKYGEITQEEMFNTFNMGIGFVIAVDSSIADAALDFFNTQGEQAYPIGKITKQPGVQFVKGS
ncbi:MULTISPECIES: phosphoribosylformylglycinamidine cyclo-ligase [Heyndrickxia]|jgi:phosphoribosylformylglycinamidine cyclo-ligase|uniref:phosphoribosylformylglycinamidine cyclo-ligase n=1 Tax=Heyndrickxia TaxID=2837504 RepID=UPI00039B3A1B|nr:phosphoribosylformylglycinamidine cyclo-ligase [Heyndrickxia oleronia]MCI1589853.1 phosphoribosylformylglycinamidine cyclo-ligase [Heyndrickxia oleronia]MCI1613439.1 phosphoribosylformylglycinamidine cyclo-ligase [Heyndrickxia oleronia]MCI1744446.1 phosphoribosylformylglycinamidine cyclo-ligase [Heyndrickxia oleronia]MCI1763761.1 phosphoribosylformylglycinamidine cyclo-ligase [Heyndrickxia oleronia]MCM3455305.1 phosphoribosylformylglycinamidine cyclo-ligase [Heyndrickxia oleronia]